MDTIYYYIIGSMSRSQEGELIIPERCPKGHSVLLESQGVAPVGSSGHSAVMTSWGYDGVCALRLDPAAILQVHCIPQSGPNFVSKQLVNPFSIFQSPSSNILDQLHPISCFTRLSRLPGARPIGPGPESMQPQSESKNPRTSTALRSSLGP